MTIIISPGNTYVAGGGGTSVAYQNFQARYATQPDATHDNAYGAFLDGLVADGILNSDGSSPDLEFLYLFATDAAANGVLNLLSSNFTCVEHGSLNFSANNGYASDGSTGYLDTQFTPNSSSKWGLNDCCLGCVDLTARTTSQGWFAIASNGAGSDGASILPFYTSGGVNDYVNLNASSGVNIGHGANSRGLFHGRRTTDQTLCQAAYYPYTGNIWKYATPAIAAGAKSPRSLYVCGRNQNGTADSFNTDRIAAAWGGASLDKTVAARTKEQALANRLKAYLTAVGASWVWT